jgi:hypothetical protein
VLVLQRLHHRLADRHLGDFQRQRLTDGNQLSCRQLFGVKTGQAAVDQVRRSGPDRKVAWQPSDPLAAHDRPGIHAGTRPLAEQHGICPQPG